MFQAEAHSVAMRFDLTNPGKIHTTDLLSNFEVTHADRGVMLQVVLQELL